MKTKKQIQERISYLEKKQKKVYNIAKKNNCDHCLLTLRLYHERLALYWVLDKND